MARNIRWFVTFKSFDGTDCRVNIYDNDWPAGVSLPLRGAADPFFYEEDDSDDLLNDVLRYRTGYIRVVEQTVGQLDDIYPTSTFDRYVEFIYGGNVEFNGYIQVQDFSRTVETLSTDTTEQCARVVELPVISPMGLADQRTFTPTPFNPPTTVTLGELLDIVMNNGVYEKVTFPNITGTGFDKEIFSLVVCPFNTDYHHSMTTQVMDRMFDPQTHAYLIECICKAYGWVCHDTPKALVFISFDYMSTYVKYPVGHIGETNYRQNESIAQVAEALTTYFTPTDAKARMSTLLPETGIEVGYEGDDGNPDFTLDRTYFVGVEMQNAQDPREISSICNLEAPLQLHELTGCAALSFDNSGKVIMGVGSVAWNGEEGILISANSTWADGRELFVVRLYRRALSGYNFSVHYDIMGSESNIVALEDDNDEVMQSRFGVTINTNSDYIEAHFIYHHGHITPGGVLPLEPLPDNYLVFIHNISFEFYKDGEPYASYRYMPASKGDVIPSTGYPAVSASVTMPISLYRLNDRLIGSNVLPSKVTEYPYLFQKRTELVGKFRGTSPDLVHTRLFTWLGKKWRVIAQAWHPWSEVPLTLTLQSSPVLDGSTGYSITASAANTSLSGYSGSVNPGASFYHNLTADTGYSISSVVILMGGVDITATAYNAAAGVINIASVTGDVVITVIAQVLPYDAEVEYLETDGNAYINTGVKVASTTTFNLHFTLPSFSENNAICGGIDTGAMVIYSDVSTNKLAWRYVRTGTTTVKTANLSQGDFILSNTSASRTLVVNGTSYNATAATFSTNADFLLFCAANGTGGSKWAGKSGVRLKSGKLYSNGTLVRDYIPVRKNGVGYLYDNVSGELFGNEGTGSFTYGNDKNS